MKNNDNNPTQPWAKGLNAANNIPRCGAKTRKETPCKSPAMANGRCRMHGGKSTGAPSGNKNALKHGLYTKDQKEFEKALVQLLTQ